MPIARDWPYALPYPVMSTLPPLEDALIHVVDDDAALRRSIAFLLESVGWRVATYASAEALLDAYRRGPPGCLVVDIRMPSMSGLELQQEMVARGFRIPVIFITGHADVSLAVQAMKQGAADFIEKPFKDQVLIDAVGHAVRKSGELISAAQRAEDARRSLHALSPREIEVARLLALGHPNKRVAARLDISERTVHAHRQHIMEKTGANSAADLVRLMLAADPKSLD